LAAVETVAAAAGLWLHERAALPASNSMLRFGRAQGGTARPGTVAG
jgi:hypothetical protein